MATDDHISPGMREQLDAPSFQGLATFGMRPFVTEPEQLDQIKPDIAVVGAPWDDSTTNRPGARFGPRALRANAFARPSAPRPVRFARIPVASALL